MSNPTTGADKADSSGRFPQAYAAEGAVLDILVKDAAGVTLQSELAIVTIGTNSGTLTRDFTNSRFSARGSGGVVYVEAGDPTGDDVGGKMSLGGWLGTQADEIDINAALVNVLGRLKEGGFRLPGIVRTAGTVFTTAATVDIPLTNDPTGVLVWDIDIIGLVCSAGAPALQARLSFDGGSTFVSALSWTYVVTSNSGGTSASSAQAQGIVAYNVGSVTNVPNNMRIRVVTPNSGSAATLLSGTFSGSDDTAGTKLPASNRFTAISTTGGRATHLRLFPDSGTTTGVYRVTPQRGFGET